MRQIPQNEYEGLASTCKKYRLGIVIFSNNMERMVVILEQIKFVQIINAASDVTSNVASPVN